MFDIPKIFTAEHKIWPDIRCFVCSDTKNRVLEFLVEAYPNTTRKYWDVKDARIKTRVQDLLEDHPNVPFYSRNYSRGVKRVGTNTLLEADLPEGYGE
jgi:hypothetical protein